MTRMEQLMPITTTLLVVLLLATNNVYASNDETMVVQSIQKDLSYDENGKLRTHYLAYPADSGKDCVPSSYDVPYGFQAVGLSGQALHDVFGSSYTHGECRAACLERGADQSVAGAVLPHKQYNAETDGPFPLWFKGACTEVEVCLMNYHDKNHPIQSYWAHNHRKDQMNPHLEIEYGEKKTRCFFSYIGHHFQVRDYKDELLGEFTIEYSLVMGFGESPPSDDISSRNVEKEIIRDLQTEWKKHKQVTRTFSPLGFAKGRLPPDVFAAMGAFYYNNRFNQVREEWNGKGVFVNWYEADVHFIQIPWRTKELWQIRLRELVEAWAGVPVEQTMMYGLRQYNSGARLLTHVDRIATHAVSLIVNIAQGNLTQPWPVEVQDHADRLHEVIMEPGDVVYYESAKCLHGRNRPMMGKDAYYVNLFTHYRPVGDATWYKKPNHEGTPEPLIEVEGECRLKPGLSVAETPSHTVGRISTVECDDKRLGPYLSPALFTATGADDLIDWWRRTSPTNDADQTCEQ